MYMVTVVVGLNKTINKLDISMKETAN